MNKEEWLMKEIDKWQDDSLIDVETGRNLYALYWEGIHSEKSKMEDGFVVKGSQIITFLYSPKS